MNLMNKLLYFLQISWLGTWLDVKLMLFRRSCPWPQGSNRDQWDTEGWRNKSAKIPPDKMPEFQF